MDDTQASNLTTSQGADAIKSILYPTQDQPAEQVSQDAPAHDGSEVELESVSDDVESQETTEDESGDDGDLYEVKVNGQVLKVPLQELIKGYQLESDYTRKTQKLAEERKALDVERSVISSVNQKFEQLNEVVTYLTQVNDYVERTLPPEPDENLLDTSPREFYRQQKAREQAIQSLMAIRGTVEQTKAQAKQVVQELQKQGSIVISQKMPDLMTPDGANRLYGYLAESYGYTGDQINNNIDPNLFIIAEKARRYDEMQGKVVKPASQPQKVMKPAQKPRPLQNSNQLQAARQSFKANGTTTSAVPLIKNILNNK